MGGSDREARSQASGRGRAAVQGTVCAGWSTRTVADRLERDRRAKRAAAGGQSRRECVGQTGKRRARACARGKGLEQGGVTRPVPLAPTRSRGTQGACFPAPGRKAPKARHKGGQLASQGGGAVRVGQFGVPRGDWHSGPLRCACDAQALAKARTSGSTVVSHGWSWREAWRAGVSAGRACNRGRDLKASCDDHRRLGPPKQAATQQRGGHTPLRWLRRVCQARWLLWVRRSAWC